VALRHNLERSRKTAGRYGRSYLEGTVTVPLSSAVSDLPSHLALLDRSAKEGDDAHREAVLLAFVVTIARIYSEVARLTAVVRVEAPRDIRPSVQPNWQRVLGRARSARSRGSNNTSATESGMEARRRWRQPRPRTRGIYRADTRVQDLRVLERRETAQEEVNSVGAFVQTLRTIARLSNLSPDDTPIP